MEVKFQDWGRDYLLFALLADVRNDEAPVPPVAPPKGFSLEWFGNSPAYELGYGNGFSDEPHEDCGAEHTESHGLSADCHSMSWLSTEELIEVQRRYVQYSADHRPHPPVGRAITYMRMLERDAGEAFTEGKFELRLLFCFDN
jgi:hypothetical protein